MKPTPSFEELTTQLNPTLEQLETERQTIRKGALKRISFWLLVMAPIIILLYLSFDSVNVIIFGGVIIIGISSWISHSRSQPLKAKYKDTIISRMIKVLVENGSYSPNSGIPERTFNESKLFISPDRYNSEDLISGKIDKTKFRFAEVHAEEKQSDSKGRTNWVTIFKGFMFIADFHKDFIGHTTISRNSLFKFKRGRVKLENPEFEKRFDVFSSDQVEARYLLTPSMMERIVELDKRFDNGIVLSFCRSNIMIFISNKDNHFEVSLWSKIDNRETLLREYSTISSLISIVEELNLNTRIWTKK